MCGVRQSRGCAAARLQQVLSFAQRAKSRPTPFSDALIAFSHPPFEGPAHDHPRNPLSPRHQSHAARLGELGKEVLIALQRLGVETIAVDRYDNAPGQQVAHHARTITMSDPAQLKALIEAERPHLVVPEIEAIATPCSKSWRPPVWCASSPPPAPPA
jgi:hypothetical protein